MEKELVSEWKHWSNNLFQQGKFRQTYLLQLYHAAFITWFELPFFFLQKTGAFLEPLFTLHSEWKSNAMMLWNFQYSYVESSLRQTVWVFPVDPHVFSHPDLQQLDV